MADRFQLGPDVTKAPYTGCDSNAVSYAGELTTVANGAAGDTVELVLCELPAGAKLESIRWAIGATLAAGTSAVFTLRKKETNAINVGTVTGVIPAAVDISPVPINGATITTTSNNQGSATLIPTNIEAAGKETLQVPYLLSMKVTTTTNAIAAGVKVFAQVSGKFIGTL